MPKQEKPLLIAQGAEAKLLLENEVITKQRTSKGYRHPLLDKKIIKQRTKSEAKILEKAHNLINSPKPIKVTNNTIEMPYIEGKKLSDFLEKLDWKSLCKQIGNKIALLHDNNIIHGDLTTSNMILSKNFNSALNKTSINKKSEKVEPLLSNDLSINNKIKNNSFSSSKDAKALSSRDAEPFSSKDLDINNIKKSEEVEQEETSKQHKQVSKASQSSSNKRASQGEPNIIFIDFGLSFISNRIEDRAVDLHLIKQALEAKHFTIHKEAEKIILENYTSKDKEKVLEQLKKVEVRGRYKH